MVFYLLKVYGQNNNIRFRWITSFRELKQFNAGIYSNAPKTNDKLFNLCKKLKLPIFIFVTEPPVIIKYGHIPNHLKIID